MSRSIGKWFLLSCAMAAAAFASAAFAQDPIIKVMYGRGTSTASGIPATSGQAQWQTMNAVGPDGAVYFSDQVGRIRKITRNGLVWTIAGPDGSSITCEFSGDDGPASAARFCNPNGVAVDSAGNVYVADSGNYRIRKISTSGVITTIAGNGISTHAGDGGWATSASLSFPSWPVLDAAGNLYFSDSRRVRRITPDGIISTVAGNGLLGFSGDGGPATDAALHAPYGLAFDAVGNLYIADTRNQRIRRVSTSGIISTVAGSGPTGEGQGAFAGDNGSALSARLHMPTGIAFDKPGNLYIADTYNYRIRKVDKQGRISTVAGNGTLGSTVDGAVATATAVYPNSVSADPDGNLWLASGQIMKLEFFTICGNQVSSTACKTATVEESIVEAMDAGSISSAVARMLLDSLTPIQDKLAWIAANPASPDLARIKRETCSLINAFNAQMDHYVRLRRLSASLRDEWKADMLEVKVELGCGN